MSSDSRPVASCDSLTKVYETGRSRVTALRDVTAAFDAASLTVVAGPSGSGKSSLLRVLAGLDAPTRGSVRVDDIAVRGASRRPMRAIRRRVGYVFQRGTENFVPYLTLGEHLRMQEREAVRDPVVPVEELVERLGIAHRVDARVDELSGGEQARGAVAQVLASGAAIVAADEPTAELDTASATALVATMRRLVDLGVTFVVASHDRTVIDDADAIVRLEHGVVRRDPIDDAPAVDDPDPRPAETGVAREVGPDAAAVWVSGVSKSYLRGDEEIRALSGVDLAVRSGESVALVGRSGSGKTTLLNVAAGWESADRGEVRTLGVDPHRSPPTWSSLAVVPQRLGLLRELSLRENVEHPFRLASGVVAPAERAAVDEVLEELAIADLADRPPARCSLGEQQRAAVARALVVGPDVLVADEPTAHLDAGSTTTVFDAIGRRVLRGMTLLIATHNPDVLALVDRVVRMRDGRIASPPRYA